MTPSYQDRLAEILEPLWDDVEVSKSGEWNKLVATVIVAINALNGEMTDNFYDRLAALKLYVRDEHFSTIGDIIRVIDNMQDELRTDLRRQFGVENG